jgi:hypothetical protein
MPPRSWALIVLLSLGFLATPLAVGAQQTSKQARIVVIGNVPLPVYENFRHRLHDLGWTEGTRSNARSHQGPRPSSYHDHTQRQRILRPISA